MLDILKAIFWTKCVWCFLNRNFQSGFKTIHVWLFKLVREIICVFVEDGKCWSTVSKSLRRFQWNFCLYRVGQRNKIWRVFSKVCRKDSIQQSILQQHHFFHGVTQSLFQCAFSPPNQSPWAYTNQNKQIMQIDRCIAWMPIKWKKVSSNWIEKKNIKIFVKSVLIKKVLFQWSHLISNQSNKQQTNKTLYLHILNLNTVALQISKETLFEAGKSNNVLYWK